MRDYILLHHNDAVQYPQSDMWPAYITKLRQTGNFDGGSAMGEGVALRREGSPGPESSHLGGFIRIRAKDLEEAKELVVGNPVYECGGTVEIRELPRT
jgi:hypothetical protein